MVKLKFFDSAKQYTSVQVKKLVQNVDYSIQLLLYVEDDRKLEELKRMRIPDNIEIWDTKTLNASIHKINDNEVPFDLILKNVLSDENYFLMKDRGVPKSIRGEFRRFLSNSDFQFITSELIFKYAKYYIALKPDYIIFNSTPHNLNGWINCLVAESLGINVVLLHRTYIQGWLYAAIGTGRKNKLITLKSSSNDVPLFHTGITEYIKRVKKSYEEAIPDYEKRRLDRNNGKYMDPIYVLRKFALSKPHWIVNYFRSWRTLSRVSVTDSISNYSPYMIFFIHYQPERTTLPEAYGYTQIINVIYSLKSVLPNGVNILLKEHPSTFTNICNPKFRHPYLYKHIASINNVFWVDISKDNFELIDNALAVITITGTVAIESLLRGTPVINYGVPVFKKSYGFYNFADGGTLRKFVSELIDKRFDKNLICKDAENKLNALAPHIVKNPPSNGKAAKVNFLTNIRKTDLQEIT